MKYRELVKWCVVAIMAVTLASVEPWLLPGSVPEVSAQQEYQRVKVDGIDDVAQELKAMRLEMVSLRSTIKKASKECSR